MFDPDVKLECPFCRWLFEATIVCIHKKRYRSGSIPFLRNIKMTDADLVANTVGTWLGKIRGKQRFLR
jgi:hypothetical protein